MLDLCAAKSRCRAVVVVLLFWTHLLLPQLPDSRTSFVCHRSMCRCSPTNSFISDPPPHSCPRSFLTVMTFGSSIPLTSRTSGVSPFFPVLLLPCLPFVLVSFLHGLRVIYIPPLVAWSSGHLYCPLHGAAWALFCFHVTSGLRIQSCIPPGSCNIDCCFLSFVRCLQQEESSIATSCIIYIFFDTKLYLK